MGSVEQLRGQARVFPDAEFPRIAVMVD
jgi:hypothetical protein